MQEKSQPICSSLQQAVNLGIDDLGAGRFRSFDTPKALVQHLQELAAAIFIHGKAASSARDVSGNQNRPKLF